MLEACGGVVDGLQCVDMDVGTSLATGLLGTDRGHIFELLSSFNSGLRFDLGKSKVVWDVTLGDGILLNAPPVGWKICGPAGPLGAAANRGPSGAAGLLSPSRAGL